MYFDKENAIKLASAARRVRDKLQEWRPDAPDMKEENMEIHHAIIELEYQLEQLDKAIKDCPSKVEDEDGNLV